MANKHTHTHKKALEARVTADPLTPGHNSEDLEAHNLRPINLRTSFVSTMVPTAVPTTTVTYKSYDHK